jgi:hypothetical protein
LLRDGAALNVLVRARDVGEAEARLWQALQLHLEFPQFYEYLQTRCGFPRRFDFPALDWGAMNTTDWCIRRIR